jgi:hypothetical protein
VTKIFIDLNSTGGSLNLVKPGFLVYPFAPNHKPTLMGIIEKIEVQNGSMYEQLRSCNYLLEMRMYEQLTNFLNPDQSFASL